MQLLWGKWTHKEVLHNFKRKQGTLGEYANEILEGQQSTEHEDETPKTILH